MNFNKLDILLKLCIALAKMHSNGVLHLDIKPENSFMMNEFTPVLGDLGLSDLKENVYDSDLSGTPVFLGKKVFKAGQYGRLREELDLYAMGIMIGELFFNFREIEERKYQAEK